MALQNAHVSFIGSGVMAEAMIKGLLKQGLVTPQQITCADPHAPRGDELIERYGLTFTTDNTAAAEHADILVISTKPQVLPQIVPGLRRVAHRASFVFSILAGVRIETLSSGLANPSVVRAMPNTPAQIGQGITVWTATREVPDAQREQARALLGALGEEIFVEDEKYLDMATALSGSGPAYAFLFMEALIDAGVHMGFSRRDAERLVLSTMAGSVEYARQSGLHPAQLRNQVTSPGGTSAEALYQLEKGGLRTVVSKAVYAAYQKSVLLGGGKDKKKADEDEV
ncbi:MAG: pyrroline-5-carboxylate reductase [Chloroflexota bacterium]|nr:pyrroline-5-carboxylate reductase [Chloroflexota bacterium]